MAIGGREKLIYDKICKVVEMKIQGVLVSMDLFLIPLLGSNVVIGIQWLEKLGNIISNYKNLTMKFNLEGKEVFCRVFHGYLKRL